MPIAEKGYRPYEGPRLSSRRNHWVIARMEARRIWASGLVKAVVIVGALPCVVPPLALLAFRYAGPAAPLLAYLLAGAPSQTDTEADPRAWLVEALDAELVLSFVNFQIAFAVLMTMAWGCTAIASDVASRSLQFYFAKPVTTRSYLLGKIIPLALYCALMCAVPASMMAIIEAVLLYSDGLALGRLSLLLPTALYSAVVGSALAVCAVAVSSLSRSRLLTLSFWGALLFLPLGVAWVIKLSTGGELQWPYLASILSVIRLLGSAIFRVTTEGQVQWYHALVVLAGFCVGAVALLRHRLSRAEVIG